jgi:hypothetical protein
MNQTGALDAMKDAAKPDAALDPAPEEIEIKLAASAKMLEQLRHHPALAGAGKCDSLRTTYFDTADGALAAGKASLRVRRRAKGCEQTLKIALGRKGQMQRSEWNQPLDAKAETPDPSAFPTRRQGIGADAQRLRPDALCRIGGRARNKAAASRQGRDRGGL